MKKIILDLCGGTGSWSKPYKDNGYNVKNITLPKYNILDLELRNKLVKLKPYGILAAPPCTYFSFARTNAKEKRNLKKAMITVLACLDIIYKCQYKIKNDNQKFSPLKFWCLENPNGMLKWFLGKPIFEFNPYDFGDNYKKKTYLWGYFNFPIKKPIKCNKIKFDCMLSKNIHPEYYGKLTRQVRRSITPIGFSKSFFEENK